jgi:aminoglycoside 3-N-acetyltransferase
MMSGNDIRSRGFRIADLAGALASISIRRGDTVVMHSSLMHLGPPTDCPLAAYPQHVIDAVMTYLGDDGTLAMPAPNWDYGSKGIPFDIRTSPVERSIGVCSAHFVTLPNVGRSPNPIFSVAAMGRHAGDICRPDTGSAFGIHSAWDRLFEMDARVLMLGSGVDNLSFARYIEFRVGVPYLYNKLFATPVVDGGKPISVTVTAPLRYRHCPAKYDLSRFSKRLRLAGVMNEARVGQGTVSMVTMSDCYRVGVEALEEDMHFFLHETPRYVPGEVPIA